VQSYLQSKHLSSAERSDIAGCYFKLTDMAFKTIGEGR
jgi:hypothetical protein